VSRCPASKRLSLARSALRCSRISGSYLAELVARLTGEEFAKGQRGRLRFLIAEWYEKNGHSVVAVNGVGNVLLDARAIERSLHHGKGRPKVAAFAVVPDVLRKGRLIHVEPLRGAKDGGRYLHFAAPIKIGGEGYIADAVLKADSNGSRLYLHNVALTKALQHPPKLAAKHRSSAVAADESTGKRSASADAGVVQMVLRGIFSVKADDAGAD